MIARAQYGTGTSGVRYEHQALPDQSQHPSQAGILQAAHRGIVARESKPRTEAEAKATAGLSDYQIRLREWERGEKAFQELLKLTKVDQAVAKSTRPWQPPVELEPELPVTPTPTRAPGIRHEVFRMSIQPVLAAMTQATDPAVPGQL